MKCRIVCARTYPKPIAPTKLSISPRFSRLSTLSSGDLVPVAHQRQKRSLAIEPSRQHRCREDSRCGINQIHNRNRYVGTIGKRPIVRDEWNTKDRDCRNHEIDHSLKWDPYRRKASL